MDRRRVGGDDALELDRVAGRVRVLLELLVGEAGAAAVRARTAAAGVSQVLRPRYGAVRRRDREARVELRDGSNGERAAGRVGELLRPEGDGAVLGERSRVRTRRRSAERKLERGAAVGVAL